MDAMKALETVRTWGPGLVIIRSDLAVAELIGDLGKFVRKGDWLNFESETYHAHIDLSKIVEARKVEKPSHDGSRQTYSVHFLDASERVVFKYVLRKPTDDQIERWRKLE